MYSTGEGYPMYSTGEEGYPTMGRRVYPTMGREGAYREVGRHIWEVGRHI